MTAVDFTVALFCRVDGAMPEARKHPLSKLYPSEVVALGMLQALRAEGLRAFHRWLCKELRSLFPRLPERSRLGRVLEQHAAWARLLLVLASHTIRCLPLVVVAFFLALYLPWVAAKSGTRYGVLALALGILCSLRWCPGFLYEEAAALGSFTFGFLLPLPSRPWTQQAGRFALGI